MTLEIVQTGDPVLRKVAKQMSVDEIRSDATRLLIEQMRDTMREAPGVGLAAPQIGESIQLAVIEDRIDYLKDVSSEELAARQRAPVDFHAPLRALLMFEWRFQECHPASCARASFAFSASRHR